MISAELMDAVACPVCLEPSGCARCIAPAGHEGCAAYTVRAACSCGGPDKVRLAPTDAGLRCSCCASVYGVADGHLALSPPVAVGEGTLYADEEFHERMEVTVRVGTGLTSPAMPVSYMDSAGVTQW